MVWLYSGVQMMLQLYGNGVQMGPVGAGATVNEVPSEKEENRRREEENRRREEEEKGKRRGLHWVRQPPNQCRVLLGTRPRCRCNRRTNHLVYSVHLNMFWTMVSEYERPGQVPPGPGERVGVLGRVASNLPPFYCPSRGVLIGVVRAAKGRMCQRLSQRSILGVGCP